MVKKPVLILLILVLCFNFTSVSKAQTDIMVVADGKTVEFADAKPYLESATGRVMVPVRFVAEALKSTVTWNSKERAVYIQNGNQSVVLTIGKKQLKVNNNVSYMDTAPVISGGRTFVPVRFVVEVLGKQVNWDGRTKKVIIQSAAIQSNPQTGITQEEQTILDLVNKAREEAGVKPLAFDINLVKTARLKANDMVQKNYFSHDSPTYGSPFDMMAKFDIEYRTAGENIAINSSAESAFKAWMNSEGHRKNILNKDYNYIGVGIASKSAGSKIFVQQFIGK